MKRLRGACALLVCCWAYALPAQSAGAPERSLGVQLALIAADAGVLADAATPPGRRAALSERIRSSLGSLGMTARDAAQATGRRDEAWAAGLRALRALFAAGKLRAFSAAARRLAAAHPVDTSYFEPLEVTPLRLEAGRSIYSRHCQGCHLVPGPGAGNWAPDLFAMARTEPRQQFIIRLLGGIYGDRTTGHANPFSDEALASLAVYFVNGVPGAANNH
ncbi:MAG TPA: cytochrome c [Rhodocyclaceae bacterium]|nr:cytochrome c [Rhodocyclaceae bacterium]